MCFIAHLRRLGRRARRRAIEAMDERQDAAHADRLLHGRVERLGPRVFEVRTDRECADLQTGNCGGYLVGISDLSVDGLIIDFDFGDSSMPLESSS